MLALAVVAVGVLGAVLGLLVAGSVSTAAGPFQAALSLRPALSGETVVKVPPLGELQLNTHDSPVRLNVALTQLRDDAARSIAANPSQLQGLGAEVDRDLRRGLRELLLRTALVTAIGAAALGILVFRRWRASLAATGAALAALLAMTGATALTFNQRALAEPRYTGLLASAPTAVGDVRDIVARFDAYSLQLGRLVTNVSKLYSVTSQLPVFAADDGTIRVLHVSDLHLSPTSYDLITSVVEQFDVDLIVDTGDSTDLGSALEARYVDAIGRLGVPYAWVRGNHDSRRVQLAVQDQPNAVVLDGPQVVEVAGLRLMGRGDPRFTPDKSTGDDDAPDEVYEAAGQRLLAGYRLATDKPDIVMVHDPKIARYLLGEAPLVLAGHTHKRSTERQSGTELVIQGSTGGAGLRALEGEEPTPVELSILYFDPVTKQLQARDDITLGGLGTSDARISRSLVEPSAAEPAVTPRPGPRPSPS